MATGRDSIVGVEEDRHHGLPRGSLQEFGPIGSQRQCHIGCGRDGDRAMQQTTNCVSVGQQDREAGQLVALQIRAFPHRPSIGWQQRW